MFWSLFFSFFFFFCLNPGYLLDEGNEMKLTKKKSMALEVYVLSKCWLNKLGFYLFVWVKPIEIK